jgi:prolyl-tRNA editing enzyme YbaK/EbsC (Cys-tRNA(Pro) deacylase)
MFKDELPPSVRRVCEAGRALGLIVEPVEMAQSTRTAEEAAAACGVGVGQIVKSLVFTGRDSGKPYLLLVSGTNRVNEKAVAGKIGEELKRPDAEAVRAFTGFAIGGIPPFGHNTPLATFFDADLLHHEVVWAAAGTPRCVFPVEPHQLRAATGAQVIVVG